MKKYRFVVAIDIPANEIYEAYKRLRRFLGILPKGFEGHVTEEAYWPSGSKIERGIMQNVNEKFERETR